MRTEVKQVLGMLEWHDYRFVGLVNSLCMSLVAVKDDGHRKVMAGLLEVLTPGRRHSGRRRGVDAVVQSPVHGVLGTH